MERVRMFRIMMMVKAACRAMRLQGAGSRMPISAPFFKAPLKVHCKRSWLQHPGGTWRYEGVSKTDEVLRRWLAWWCSGCAAWTETRPCPSQAYGSSSSRPCTSPVGDDRETRVKYFLFLWSIIINMVYFLMHFSELFIHFNVGLLIYFPFVGSLNGGIVGGWIGVRDEGCIGAGYNFVYTYCKRWMTMYTQKKWGVHFPDSNFFKILIKPYPRLGNS